MADTMQIVRWALGQTCKLRAEDAYTDAARALVAVSLAEMFSSSLDRRPGEPFGVYGDVCVTSYSSIDPPEGVRSRDYTQPHDGFVVSGALRDVGGAEGLTAMCRTCPANTAAPRPAGCAGTLYQHPRSQETQEQLESIISRLGLADAMADAFPATTPIWYGLWTASPLEPNAVALLRTLIGEIRREDAIDNPSDTGHLGELDAFLRATELTERHGLPLAVSMAPPGHTDLGYYTIFPHCPFCKAEAQLERWKRKYDVRHIPCHVCGTSYSPAETSSSERDPSEPDLRAILGEERYREFFASYLVTHGATPADAALIAAHAESKERERQQQLEAETKRWRDQDRFVAAVLYDGLQRRKPPADGDGDEESESDGMWWFDAADFERILERCDAMAISVTTMWHQSAADEAFNRFQALRGRRALKEFAKWGAEGCRELFSASLKVPDPMLDEWLAKQ